MTGRGKRLFTMLAFFAVACTAWALEVPLKEVKKSAEDKWPGFRPMGMRMAGQLAAKPQAKLKLPKFVSPKPVFGSIELGGKTFHFALDNQAKEDKFFRRLLFDRNNNLDLTDDPPCECKSFGDTRVNFEPLEIQIEIHGKTMPYTLDLEAADFTDSFQKTPITAEHIFCMVNSSCAYLGECDLGGKHYLVALADMNCNGAIDDCFSLVANNGVMATSGGKQVLYNQGDAFLMTTNKTFDANDLLVLGTHLAVGGVTYAVRVDMGGPKLILEPVAKGLAPLAIPAGTQGLELTSADHKVSVMMIDPGPTVQIPSGRYSIFKYMLGKQDAQGDTWCAVAQAGAGANADNKVIVGGGEKPAALRFGEPFRLSVSASKGGATPPEAQLMLAITDAAGMDVRGVFHVAGDKTKIGISKDKNHAAEPAYIISKPGGAEIARGQFEYG